MHGLAAAPPNPYAVSQGTVSPSPSQVSYLLSGFLCASYKEDVASSLLTSQ